MVSKIENQQAAMWCVPVITLPKQYFGVYPAGPAEEIGLSNHILVQGGSS